MKIRCYVINHAVKKGGLLLERKGLPLQDKTTCSIGLYLGGSITPWGRYRTTRRGGCRNHTHSRVRWHTRRTHLLGSRAQIGSSTPRGSTRRGSRLNRNITTRK